MGKHLLIFALLGSALMLSCSANIGEANGKSLSHREFIGRLMDSHPQYFNKSRGFVEEKLYDWKRLKVALEEYLGDEAIHRDLIESGFKARINPKRKELYRLITLGVFSRLNTARRTNLNSLMKSEKNIIYKTMLPLNLDDKQERPVIQVKGHITLTQKDLMAIFPDRNLKELNELVRSNVLPNLYYALEGTRLGLDRDSVFKRYWNMRWRFYLIKEYRNKVKTDIVNSILADNSDRLKKYFEENKNRYVIYKKNNKIKDDKREKYQYSFLRLRDSVAKDLSEEDMERWKRKIMIKYNCQVNDDYFNELGKKEITKYKNQ